MVSGYFVVQKFFEFYFRHSVVLKLLPTRGFAKVFVQKVNSFFLPAGRQGLVLRRTMEGDANTRTPIIVTKLPGTDLFIQVCCTGCGARPRADGKNKRISIFHAVMPGDTHRGVLFCYGHEPRLREKLK